MELFDENKKTKPKKINVKTSVGDNEPMKFYNIKPLLKHKALYYIIYGLRSNGKTTAVIGECLEDYIKSGYKKEFAIIRRYEQDFKDSKKDMFGGIILEWLEKWTKGKYNTIINNRRHWFLAHINEDGEVDLKHDRPFAYAFSITSEEHYKSALNYDNIKNILFDEFVGRDYIPDEYVKFMHILSTIIRNKDDVRIFMCGNKITKYCPYFAEMGLKHIKDQLPGTIDEYTYSNKDLKVAVEHCEKNMKSRPSDKYFAFDNPKLKMITTDNNWEIDIYPHLPIKYVPKEIRYIFFIKFYEDLMQCEVIYSNKLKTSFIYIHRKTTPIKDDNKNIVFQVEHDCRANYRRKLTKPTDKITEKIYDYFYAEKVYYQDNEIGDIVSHYIKWCKTN